MSTAPRPSPVPFTVRDRGLRGELVGEGLATVLLHGLTATRRQVVHGSRVLPREGHLTIAYDARGHGESDPAPGGEGYGYPRLIEDLDAVVDAVAAGDSVLLVGHSMGAHTAAGYALENAERVAGLVLIGPVYPGYVDEEAMGEWDALAAGLERGGVEGFLEALDARGIHPDWRETVLRISRERMEAHRDLGAIAAALREVPRSRPFESLDELDFLDVPALVVASHDVADPGHPYAVAEAYAAHLPGARLVSEAEGESPLAWQGGRLSREIAAFARGQGVQARLA